MIDEQLEEIERALKGASLVIFSDFQRIYTSPNSAYVKGEARFMNNSFLNLFHHVCSMVGVGFRLRPTQLTWLPNAKIKDQTPTNPLAILFL